VSLVSANLSIGREWCQPGVDTEAAIVAVVQLKATENRWVVIEHGDGRR
jgi:hypothetical protein